MAIKKESEFMKLLDYASLQPISKNTADNKATNSQQSIAIMLGLLDYQNNFEEYIRNSSCYDSASTLIAENDWLKRRTKNSFPKEINDGAILKTDFGKGYFGECAYIHFSLCIRKYKNKILVVPMTSVADTINKAYHPIDNPKGEYRLRVGKKEEGFPLMCALFMNDAKFISIGRIVDCVASIDIAALELIKRHLLSIAFPKFDSELTNLQSNSNLLQDEIAALKKENATLKFEMENLQKTLTTKDV